MKLLKIKLLIIALMLFAATSSFASLSYDVNVNTTSLNGTSGYLYLQYIPVDAGNSTATVYNFATDGTLGAQSFNVVNGSAVTGVLPGTVTFANTNGINDYNHAITLGNTIHFNFSFTNPGSGGITGGSSTLSLGLFSDEGGTMPLLNVGGANSSVPGTLFTASLMNDGTVSTPQILASQASVKPVPIPGALLLFGPGLAGLVALRKKLF